MIETQVIEVTDHELEAIGGKSFQTLPRQGEWVVFAGEATSDEAYEVVQVVHSPYTPLVDVYVKSLGPTADVLKKLSERK